MTPNHPSILVRNLRRGEQATLPLPLLNTGMPFLDESWVWVVEPADPADATGPFALLVTSFAHGWLLLHRVLALSPLPPTAPLNWFLEALLQVFAEARSRGCVAFMTMLSDDQPTEVKLARIVQKLPNAVLMPMRGSMAAGLIVPMNGGQMNGGQMDHTGKRDNEVAGTTGTTGTTGSNPIPFSSVLAALLASDPASPANSANPASPAYFAKEV